MFRYQIRMPKSMSLEDLLDDLASKSWSLLKDRLHWEPMKDRYYPKFRMEIYDALSPHLKGYLLCGSSGICDDEARPIGSTYPRFLNVRIRHLIVPEPLDHFFERLAIRVLGKMKPLLRDPAKQKIVVSLKLAFDSIFSEYLCWNPWCGKAQICLNSAAIDPFGKGEEQRLESAG